MSSPVSDFAKQEFEYLRERSSRDFFLALDPYLHAIGGQRRIRRVLEAMQRETEQKLQGFVAEQNDFIEQAKEIRDELAARAPQVDNSDMEEPDYASRLWARYELDSFARFDGLADGEHRIAYPTQPR